MFVLLGKMHGHWWGCYVVGRVKGLLRSVVFRREESFLQCVVTHFEGYCWFWERKFLMSAEFDIGEVEDAV